MVEWKNIHNTLYEVSDEGEVRSPSGQILKQQTWKGYKKVTLYVLGRKFNCKVHQLVLMSFTERKSPGATLVRHLDGDRGNNHADNLAWGTDKTNAADRIEHGTQIQGFSHPLVTMTKAQAQAIRKAFLTHMTERKKKGYQVAQVGYMGVLFNHYYELYGSSLTCVKRAARGYYERME